ncbi:MAG: metal-dependent transcriptional regulator [Saprospiraceae bacterium]|nr:metal-dependent transcriptional regulator [Saprospiraceae bacterium]
MQLTNTEENYLKAIYKISERTSDQNSSTNAIASEIGTTAASVSDMLRKLADKGLVHYEKYYGASLTKEGLKNALQLIRKHRIWEVFLHDALHFSWDEIHEMAEELEHVRSEELINRLEVFLGHPKFDPHGDPIPSQSGSFTYRPQVPLSNIKSKDITVSILGVKNSDQEFLKFLDSLDIKPGVVLRVIDYTHFNKSITLINENHKTMTLGFEITKDILVKESGS